MFFLKFYFCKTQTLSVYRHHPEYRVHGLTLIECLIALSLIGIIGLLALPSFSKTLQDAETVSLARRLHISLNYARSTAISRRQRTIVCGSSGDVCDDPANWENGWIVFVDANENHRRDAVESIAWTEKISDSSPGLFFRGGAARDRMVRFKAHGSGWPNGTFFVCAKGRQLRRIIMYRSGRSRIAAASDGGCPN